MKINKIIIGILLISSCSQNNSVNKKVELNIEIEKINDTLSKATLINLTEQDGKEINTIRIIEGTPGDVKAQIEEIKNTSFLNQNNSYKNLNSKTIEILLEPKNGSLAKGTVRFDEDNGLVKLNAIFSGLNEGIHAIHIHEKADCSSDDAKSSGGHWNPTFQSHGKWGDVNGFHLGDIGNFAVNSSGDGYMVFETDLWCLSCDDLNKNISGKAIIVHQGEDDLVSQPSGAAGSRISCGGIIY
tara:strand:+ start:276 stop:1001 length:726 start_codon:yes stop_codon:yes gene_type:complete